MFPVRILEPGDLYAVADMDVAFEGRAGHIVMLEGDALVFERPDDPADLVADRPGHSSGLIGAGKLRAVDIDECVAALHHDHVVALFVNWCEAERLFVEFPGGGQVLDGYVCRRVGFSEHVNLL